MMTQKSNEEIYKSLSEEERNVTVTSVELTDKAFKGKTDYSAIARLNGKVLDAKTCQKSGRKQLRLCERRF